MLDKPTSVLTPREATEMPGPVRGLAHSGALTIVIITHKLKEVAAFVDEVTVPRRGRMAGTGAVEVLGGQRPCQAGSITVDGAPYDANREQSQARGVRVLPEEPLRNGCVPPMTGRRCC